MATDTSQSYGMPGSSVGVAGDAAQMFAAKRLAKKRVTPYMRPGKPTPPPVFSPVKNSYSYR